MISLIRPPAVECVRFATTSAQLPLGLAYIAGALEAAGRSVEAIDAVGLGPDTVTKYLTGYLVGMRLEELAARVPKDAEWVGISVIFTHEWPAVVRLVDLIKARLPNLPVVLGGEHVTSMPEFCMVTSKADYLVLGEGEEIVVDVCAVVDGQREPHSVDGLVYRDDAGIVVNKRRARQRDIDAIAYPAWHHFDVEAYHRNRLVASVYTERVTVPILATRGCPYQCTYCSAPNMWTPRWIPRDPVKVVDEIEHWVQRYGAGSFPFQDLTAIIRKDWIVAFCKELLRRKLDITWQLPIGTRSEAIDSEVAELLRKTNMVSMAYAPESGSESTRQFIKKKIHTEPLFESVRAAVGAELNVSFYIVIGFPHETAENLRDSVAFLERAAHEGITDVSVGYYMALPGTELFNSLYDAGKIVVDHEYFTHMLHALAATPVRSFSDHLTRTELILWKFRLFAAFYGTKAKLEGSSKRIVRLFRAFQRGSHQTKMETVARNLVQSVWRSGESRFRPRWMPAADEAAFFAGWDEHYRAIRNDRRSSQVSPAWPVDTRLLHTENVIVRLRKDHETLRRLPIELPAPAGSVRPAPA